MTDARRLSQTVFYLDESIYSRVLYQAMCDVGAIVERVGIAVPFGSDDEVWLRLAAKKGWIALMRDQRVRRRRLEREALKTHGVAAFAFTGGEETAAQTAQTICPLLTKFANMYVSEPKPFLYTFAVSGSLSRVRL